uniref:Uncharacterized protein LOC113797788 n=1 Tax=Dermatophagoides pteronyssinus TaxID=6956 RepID=A0A6P6YFK2_DERPT
MSETSSLSSLTLSPSTQSTPSSSSPPIKVGSYLKSGTFKIRNYNFPDLTPGLESISNNEMNVSELLKMDILSAIRSYCVEVEKLLSEDFYLVAPIKILEQISSRVEEEQMFKMTSVNYLKYIKIPSEERIRSVRKLVMKLAKEPPSSFEECFLQFLIRARESRKERLKSSQKWVYPPGPSQERRKEAAKSRAAQAEEARKRKSRMTLKGQIEELKMQLNEKNTLISALEKKIRDLEEEKTKTKKK